MVGVSPDPDSLDDSAMDTGADAKVNILRWQIVNLRKDFNNCSDVDPDPFGSAFIFPPGSGSRRGKFERENRKNAMKMKENCNFIIKCQLNVDKLHCL